MAGAAHINIDDSRGPTITSELGERVLDIVGSFLGCVLECGAEKRKDCKVVRSDHLNDQGEKGSKIDRKE